MKSRVSCKHAVFVAFVILIITFFVLCFAEMRIRPIVNEAAKSSARSYASEVINLSVTDTLSKSNPLVRVSSGEYGVASVETDIASLSHLRAEAIKTLNGILADSETMSFSVPLGNLSGSMLIAGRGRPIEIRLVPIGDVTADIHTEFIESGINQTLHKISMRVRVTLNVLTAGSTVKLEVANNITLAETVIVGKVPDAYTAINRYEIDEEEENDLNDYAATLP